MDLPPAVFEELCRLVHRLCGLVIAEDKAYLVRHRLEGVVRAGGCRDFRDFAERLRGPQGVTLHEPIVEAITTAETSFFRDGHPFETFRRHLLPRLAERARARPPDHSGPRVRLWCAGAATGQEPYSLAMVLHDFLGTTAPDGLGERDFRLLATDVSAKVLATAAAGVYAERDLARGLTAGQVGRYFERHGEAWVVREPIRRLVEFRRFNLLQSASALGSFDAIFCRNVLIYFDDATRRQLCEQFHARLLEGGWLVLGAAENLYGIGTRFESVRLGKTMLYQKRAE
jgi:chemotaxis protein methyltransferase CheR